MDAEEVAGEEWAEWYRLTPQERFLESSKLWETYLALGGSLEPEPDTQSPFFDPEESIAQFRSAVEAALSGDSRASLHALEVEEDEERRTDRLHWEPLKRELEGLRRKKRQQDST